MSNRINMLPTEMSESGSNQEWIERQQEYWEQWSRQFRQALPEGDSQAGLWEQVIEQWWRAIASPSMHEELMSRMASQGQALFFLADLFLKQQDEESPPDWGEALDATFGHLRAIFGSLARSFTPVADEMLDPAQGTGFGRGTLEQQQRMAQALLAYQQAQAAYEQFFASLGSEAVGRLQQRLAEPNQEVASARELYDLWIAICEEVYAERAISPEYASLYSRLINSLMAVKRQMIEMLDSAFEAMRMPTSADFKRLLQQRQQDRRELVELRRQVGQLTAQLAAAGKSGEAAAKSQSAKKRTAKKKVVKKRASKQKGVEQKRASVKSKPGKSAANQSATKPSVKKRGTGVAK